MTPETIGKVSSVHGFRVTVDLEPSARSPIRAGMQGAFTAVAINAYVSFDIGAGEVVIGVITDLDSREAFDPELARDMTLELVKPRRTALVQLLGTLRHIHGDPGTARGYRFDPGIMLLPTLETPATASLKPHLDAVFREAPKRNQPVDVVSDNYDHGLPIGVPTVSAENQLFASFNDLFTRPLAIVGNTGSGKSYTVASLVQRALAEIHRGRNAECYPRFFVLDINGEYGPAFRDKVSESRQPDHVYINGVEFSIPMCLMSAREVCLWLDAAGKTQEPVLKDNWSLLKGEAGYLSGQIDYITGARQQLSNILNRVNGISYAGENVQEHWAGFCDFALRGNLSYPQALFDQINEIILAIDRHRISRQAAQITELVTTLRNQLSIREASISAVSGGLESADKPIFFPISQLRSGLVVTAQSEVERQRVESYIETLQLRLSGKLADPRWHSFRNYEAIGLPTFEDWLKCLNIQRRSAGVDIIDLSMLSYEVLPFAAGIFARVVLELRQKANGAERYRQPWVIVLEEAHSYARPARQDEDNGHLVSREAFERIAKEGRKFGLSLIVASQRPSEISPTILSQCANFLMHRLQNPQDIEHFKSIIPSQSRRLLDQIAILAAGEAIAFGSAFQVPTRVKVHEPDQRPWSQTSAPWLEWRDPDAKPFDVDAALRNWGLSPQAKCGAIWVTEKPNAGDGRHDDGPS